MTRPDRPRATTTTVVVAAAGYGKSTWVEGGREAMAEDLHLLPVADQAELVSRVLAGRGADAVDLVLTSRRPLDPKIRGLLPGAVRERGPSDLALTPQGVAAVLAEEYALTDPELPSRLHSLTAGWPALVHLAADAVSRSPGEEPTDLLTSPGSATVAWLEHDVVAGLPPEVADLLAGLAAFDLVTPGLMAAALGTAAEDRWAADAYAELVQTGLLVAHPRDRLLGRGGHRVVPLLSLALRRSGSDPGPASRRRAAEWYADHDAPYAAVRSLDLAGDRDSARAVVAERGTDMVAQGDAEGIVDLLTEHGRPLPDLTDAERGILGEALNTTGDGFAALGVLGPLAEASGRSGLDAGLAVRLAAVHFSQGELRVAAEVLDRVPADALPCSGAGIAWRAARVNVRSMLGEDDAARDLAAETLRLAEVSGAAIDLAAAHQAVAKTSAGSRKAAHLRLALTAARRAGDAVTVARILGNQTYSLLAGVRCDEAVAVGREAVRATELVRPMGALTAALHNLAEALSRTGEYDEARWHLRRAAAVSQRIGPNRAASSLCGLGEVHRALGRREQGRAAYQEAITLARTSQELQVLVPALAGLSRLLVHEHPEEARVAADEAAEVAPPGLAAYALIAQGWVERVAGAPELAADLAAEAAGLARAQHSLDLLADALELAALCETDPGRARTALEEARSIWRSGGAAPDADRLEVLLGRLDGADRAARRVGREAAERLQRLGVTELHGRALTDDPAGKAVSVQLLGRFEVSVDGSPVPLQAWRSRQARTLVKVLAARRGRPVSRGELCEVLWPDADPVKTSHRLSVLLTTVRGVFDPAKAWPPDRYLASDNRGVWFDLRRVGIDADDLLADADHGAELLALGQVDRASEVLAQVDARYRGEAFEDEPFEAWVSEDWAISLREETRAAWLRSLRHQATVATRQGRSNDASAILVRLLSVDPYDERVHRGLVRTLVRAGRHGEARRAFDRWTEAMTTVDAPPPDPAELVPRPRGAD